MRTWIILLAGLIAPVWSLADPLEELYTQANTAFQNNSFDQAIALYDSILTQGYESAEVYYNLGNAHYKTNQVAPAIYNYERALKLNPGHADARFNLKMANLRVIDNIEATPEVFFTRWGKALVNSNSSGGWGWVSVLAMWLALAGGAAFLFAKPIGVRRLGFYGGIAALIIGLIFLLLGNRKLNKERNSLEGIIFSQNAYVKSAPDASGTDLFILHEGVKVGITEEYGAWNRIRLADGKEGWIETHTLKTI